MNSSVVLKFRPRSMMQALCVSARISVVNRYKYDYACEDEYFQRDMTLLEARKLPLPLPDTFRHKSPPVHEIWPAHWNDVRFNFRPEFIDRRMFVHDNYQNAYDFPHDYLHTVGYHDEDLDYELPDPYTAMHFKKKRSQVTSIFGAVIAIGLLILYPIVGLKMPQRDNPFYYRKKYGTGTTIEQQQ